MTKINVDCRETTLFVPFQPALSIEMVSDETLQLASNMEVVYRRTQQTLLELTVNLTNRRPLTLKITYAIVTVNVA